VVLTSLSSTRTLEVPRIKYHPVLTPLTPLSPESINDSKGPSAPTPLSPESINDSKGPSAPTPLGNERLYDTPRSKKQEFVLTQAEGGPITVAVDPQNRLYANGIPANGNTVIVANGQVVSVDTYGNLIYGTSTIARWRSNSTPLKPPNLQTGKPEFDDENGGNDERWGKWLPGLWGDGIFETDDIKTRKKGGAPTTVGIGAWLTLALVGIIILL
jgi:hypothetical protein